MRALLKAGEFCLTVVLAIVLIPIMVVLFLIGLVTGVIKVTIRFPWTTQDRIIPDLHAGDKPTDQRLSGDDYGR